MALLPALPADGPGAGGPAVPVPGDGAWTQIFARRERAHPRDRAVQPQRPQRGLPPADELRRLLERLPEHVIAPARRGAGRLRRRRAARQLPRPARRLPPPARVPHLLEGLRPGRDALRLRDGRARLRAAARADRAGAGSLATSSRRAPWRRCASAGPLVERRRESGAASSAHRLLESLGSMPWTRRRRARPDVSCGCSAPGLAGGELATRLRRSAVLVHPGSEYGEPDHVRATIQSPGDGPAARAAAGRYATEPSSASTAASRGWVRGRRSSFLP